MGRSSLLLLMQQLMMTSLVQAIDDDSHGFAMFGDGLTKDDVGACSGIDHMEGFQKFKFMIEETCSMRLTIDDCSVCTKLVF